MPDATIVDTTPVDVDRSQYEDVGLEAHLDYTDMGMWACNPLLKNNECHANLDATELLADGSMVEVPHTRAETPEIDCFYVYPTVLNDGRPNMTDFSEAGLALVRDALFSQAARFNELCEVYVPLYRQRGLSGTSYAEGADGEVPVRDIRDAFASYLEHHNRGREFVLIGHSQGTSVLISAMQMDVDPVAHVRERMLSAILLGGRVRTAVGETTGSTFENIPTCQEPGDTGCLIAYASYHADTPPGETANFGSDGDGTEGVCTDPLLLANRTGTLTGSYYPLHLNNAAFRTDWEPPEGINTPFLLYRDVLSAKCARTDGGAHLEVSSNLESGDPRLPPYRSAIEAIGWGLHLTDFNSPLSELIEAVRLQAKSAR